MNSTRLIQLAAVALAIGIVSTRVQALPAFPPSGPLIKISELSTGAFADPNAQYMVLRMVAGTTDSNNVRGYTVVFYQPDFHEIGRFGLAADANRGARGAPYLIANPAAQKLYHVLADGLYTGQPWPTQGYICVYKPGSAIAPNSVQDPKITKDDCLVYGNVTDANTYLVDPSLPNVPFNPAGGVPRGFIARRALTPGLGSSARDFVLINPNQAWPANNRGVVGSPNSTPCGSGTLDGSKQCDEGSTKNGVLVPGCSSACLLVNDPNVPTCGNGEIDPGEACDDGSTVDHDGCSSLCQWEFLLYMADPACGNGILEVGESCDSAMALPTAACDAQCAQINPPVPVCGDDTVQEGEQCDGTDCDADTCAWQVHTPACGNALIEPGEECDDGNTNDADGCSADCHIEFNVYYHCGELPPVDPQTNPNNTPAILEPGEQCEPTLTAQCNADCTWVNAVSDPNIPDPSSTGGTNTAGPGVNTTAGGGGASTSASTSTGGSGTGGGSTSTGGTGAAGTSGGDSTSSGSSATTGGDTVIKSTSCAQGGAPGLLWTLSAAALLWGRRKRTACTLG